MGAPVDLRDAPPYDRRMQAPRAFAAVSALLALAGHSVAAASAAAVADRPSERACLLSWNAPSNAASRRRVAERGPWSAAILSPGTTAMVTWRRGSPPAVGPARPGCLLRLLKPGQSLLVAGAWRNGAVRRWSFGPAIPSAVPRLGNVRVLPDGRVTKRRLR